MLKLYVIGIEMKNGKTKYFVNTGDNTFKLNDDIFTDDEGFVSIYSDKEKASAVLKNIASELTDLYYRYNELVEPIGDSEFHVIEVEFKTSIAETIIP